MFRRTISSDFSIHMADNIIPLQNVVANGVSVITDKQHPPTIYTNSFHDMK